jgi:nucleoid-associated protein YgaU
MKIKAWYGLLIRSVYISLVLSVIGCASVKDWWTFDSEASEILATGAAINDETVARVRSASDAQEAADRERFAEEPEAGAGDPAYPDDEDNLADVIAGLIRYYTVQQEDSFWSISGKSFIYDNPFLWYILYNANKDKLLEPDNPRYIEPGIVMEIPSIHGEIREGTR